jgi:hypothetical protein
MSDRESEAMRDMLPGAAMPAPDGGQPFHSTRVTNFATGDQYLDRDDGGAIRTVAAVRSVIRLEFEPLDGHPDHRDHALDRPHELRQFRRKGAPKPRSGPTLDALEGSWEHRDLAAADSRIPYPIPSREDARGG